MSTTTVRVPEDKRDIRQRLDSCFDDVAQNPMYCSKMDSSNNKF
ncbi:hypothetical protein BMS3Abin07_00090 [bacterium BMS3Abin07]|nr:hypothetical protein BMS3Abin07_00090 [bacterium BMS3Abin07]